MAAPNYLSKWLEANYPLSGVLQVSLIRSYTNDVFLVELPANKYVLKVYRKGWRTLEEIGWEIDFLDHLTARGLRAAKAVRGRDGEAVRVVETPFGAQGAALFEYAEGEKPSEPFSKDLYFRFGRTIGEVHRLSDGFTSEHQRKPIDLAHMVNAPLAVIIPYLGDGWQRDILLRVANEVAARVVDFDQKGLDWGPVHFDATLDNLHVTADGEVTLFDFDSGGPGWRASDLQGWAVHMPERWDHHRAFLSGYRSVRALAERDLQAAPWLTLAWEFWRMKVEVENRLASKGEPAIQRYLRGQIEYLDTLFGKQKALDR